MANRLLILDKQFSRSTNTELFVEDLINSSTWGAESTWY